MWMHFEFSKELISIYNLKANGKDEKFPKKNVEKSITPFCFPKMNVVLI